MPDLNFDGQNTLYATHGLHAYAAKCPPQLVRYGLHYYSKPGETVLDPMAGSGSTLVESRLMGRHAQGYDIDPLARLIAQVKSCCISDKRIQQAYEVIAKRFMQDLAALRSHSPSVGVCRRAIPPDFPNRDYWFSPDVSTALSILSYHISHTPMAKKVQAFFWVAFSSLILARTSVANARDIIHSRHHYWQHSQQPDVRDRFTTRVTQMRKQMADFCARCDGTPPTAIEARLGDARNLKLNEETIDLIFTSPPYVTALDYTRAHFLAVPWMKGALGIGLEEYFAKGPAYIGSDRGKLPPASPNDALLEKLDLTQAVITKLAAQSPLHARRARRYFVDMYLALREMARVLKHRRHAVIVVCPSHIRKVKIPTHEMLIEIGSVHGLKLKKNYTRTISERRRILPYMQEAFGKRMDTEYVLIFQKTHQ